MRNDRPWVAAQMSNRKSQAEEYAEAHCDTLVDWLKNNTDYGAVRVRREVHQV